jgi:exodeoxyribonuclease VII small subunit
MMKHDAEEKEPFVFEQAIERLEEVVSLLEKGEASLDESIRLYDEGMKLVHTCSEKLAWAEQQVEILLEKDGKVIKAPFQPEDDFDD